MTKLVAFNNLQVGTTYYEDCIFGTETIKMTVVERIDSLHLKVQYEDCKEYETIKPNKDYRFWDAEPSLMERELAHWKRT